MSLPLPSIALALALAAPGWATPERAAQQAEPPQAAMMPGAGEGAFPPAMMQAIAEQEAMMASQGGAADGPAEVAPAPITEPPAAAAAPSAAAQTEPLPQLSEPPQGAPITDQAEVDRRAQTIAEGLRCPVCQGLSAGDSQAESAIAMRTRAGDLVAAGYSDQQINAYFVERYGEWVLLEPPRSGRHWLIWLGPLAFLGLGLLIVAWRMTSDKPPKAPITIDDADEDPYEKRILDELERS